MSIAPSFSNVSSLSYRHFPKQPNTKRAPRWVQPSPKRLPWVLRLLAFCMGPLEYAFAHVAWFRVVASRVVEASVFLVLVACFMYLLSLWDALNPFSSLCHTLQPQAAYSVEHIKTTPYLQLAQAQEAETPFIAIHTPG